MPTWLHYSSSFLCAQSIHQALYYWITLRVFFQTWLPFSNLNTLLPVWEHTNPLPVTTRLISTLGTVARSPPLKPNNSLKHEDPSSPTRRLYFKCSEWSRETHGSGRRSRRKEWTGWKISGIPPWGGAASSVFQQVERTAVWKGLYVCESPPAQTHEGLLFL